MTTAAQEQQRYSALHRLNLLDTLPEERFDRLTRIAKQSYGVRIALFSLIDAKRQWFKSKQGTTLSETPRAISFCDHTIRENRLFVVPDTWQDRRFRDNPLVVGEPYIRFYAGVPIREPTGSRIGTLCLLDSQPRDPDTLAFDVLRNLGALMEEEVSRVFHETHAPQYIDTAELNLAIQKAQNLFLTNDTEYPAFEALLEEVLTMTDSQFGLIGEARYDADGAPYLKVEAISNIAWNPEMAALYQQVERRGMVFDRLDSLLCRPLLDQQMVLSDSVMDDDRGAGLPDGHPRVGAYIGIPIHSGDQLIGLVGLANRRGGYDPRLALELEPLLQTMGTLIERKRLREERKRHEQALEKAANYDSLTGLPNRRLMHALFERELCEADERRGVVSVCYLDLDHFKDINDAHGHVVGDAVLKNIAQSLQNVLREHDVIARLGGDEFVAILRDVESPSVYQRMLEAVGRPVNYQQGVIRVSASMGVTIYPDDCSDSDQLMRHADQAMYAAKEFGKNCYKLFDLEMHHSRRERVRVLEQMNLALARRELVLFYQPKVNFRVGRVEGFEALIRWRHPERGLLMPDQFLPHVEYSEFDAAIGRYVLETAVETLRDFERLGHDYTLSVNLSPSHFLNDTFIPDLGDALKGCSLALRRRLVLEILETTALTDLDAIIRTINTCREMGVSVSLDDFGTGYSSLDYFRRLPVNEIKIDKSFVIDLLNDPDNEMIVDAISSLSRSFRRHVVVEGVESAEVAERLIAMGCDVGQGFYFSRPVHLKEALAWAAAYPDGQG
ncbi:hypothetical protein CF392_13515 [Tamilnaduibacter salinus]|uniref:Diguanylate cyclase/phosphodiesterase with GAF sensor n=1 Tax=Tamilnaduibacter salinus TaxID=1484056 RepID=A0A2A2I0L8_9GAMM|nr:EAL domain-containing protein [Tamilnaduibacter salinus]PAV24938.1 hypothetical protein CF392_13515 [Tamilnaduibacter salinus]